MDIPYFLNVFYYFKIILLDLALILCIYPIFKVYTKQIRWYQTPFIFIFFCLVENLLTLVFGILYSFDYFEDQVQFWFSFILEVILINTIIFIDS